MEKKMHYKTLEAIKKEFIKLDKTIDTTEANLKMYVKNFTDYKIEAVQPSKAWYELTKNDIEIILDEETKRPADIEEWLWNKLIDYVGALEIQYNRYIKLMNEIETAEQ